LIVLLRSLDMPLQEVARVVAAAGPEAADLIASYWASQERRFAAADAHICDVAIPFSESAARG
jgi:hypothetical protein